MWGEWREREREREREEPCYVASEMFSLAYHILTMLAMLTNKYTTKGYDDKRERERERERDI